LSLAMSGNNMQKATSNSSTPATGISMAAQDQAVTRSSHGNGTAKISAMPEGYR
jgi:hypothetical protein